MSIFIKYLLKLAWNDYAIALKKRKLARMHITTCSGIVLFLAVVFFVAPIEADDSAFQSSVVTVRGIVTEQITPGEARNAFNDYLTQIRNGNGSEAIDKYFDAMTYIKLSFSDYLSAMNRNELEALREEFINYIKKVMSMPAIRKLKHYILEERIITNGFAEVKYLDAYGTPLEMEHTIIFRKIEGRLLYFDMRREGQSMPKMFGKLYSQYSGELSPIAFIKTLNDSLSGGQ